MSKFENEWTKEIDRLKAERAGLLEILRKFIDIDDADKGGKALFSCQGQGMDGYMKLANYEGLIPKARAAVANTERKEP